MHTSLQTPVPVCSQSCEYRVRREVKRCGSQQKFVHLADVRLPEGQDADFRNIAVGGFLTRDYENSHCMVTADGYPSPCCNPCYASFRLQMKEQADDLCSEAVFEGLADYTILADIYEKQGEGECCSIEYLRRRVVLSGDVHVNGGSRISFITPLDICFLDDGEK